jgi:hypothetical protein
MLPQRPRSGGEMLDWPQFDLSIASPWPSIRSCCRRAAHSRDPEQALRAPRRRLLAAQTDPSVDRRARRIYEGTADDHGRIGGGHRALPLRHCSYRVDEMRKSAKARTFAERRCRDGVARTRWDRFDEGDDRVGISRIDPASDTATAWRAPFARCAWLVGERNGRAS